MNHHLDRVAAAVAAWNAGDLDAYLSLYDDGVTVHGYAPAPMDRAAVGEFYRATFGTLHAPGRPNPILELHEQLVDGDMVAARFTMSGVQQGEFMGVPPTGAPYRLEGMTMLRFGPAGTVVERWSSADFLSMFVQIGAIPAPT